jgi:hypothetical protein
MTILAMFLMVLGLVLFFLAMIGQPSPPRFNLMAGGLFCWLLAELTRILPLTK